MAEQMHLHLYRVQYTTPVWAYLQCRCGARRARRHPNAQAWQPVDQHWVETGEHSTSRPLRTAPSEQGVIAEVEKLRDELAQRREYPYPQVHAGAIAERLSAILKPAPSSQENTDG